MSESNLNVQESAKNFAEEISNFIKNAPQLDVYIFYKFLFILFFYKF